MRELIRALLIKIRLITPSVEESYMAFVAGYASADLLCKYLRVNQIAQFVEIHTQVKAFLEGEQTDLSPAIVLGLTQLLTTNSRRFHVALAQVDALIERGLEKQVLRKKGKNVVHRDSPE